MRCSTETGRERGAAILEFVLVLPFLFLILVLVVDFGTALIARQRAAVAVRELAFRHSARSAGLRESAGPALERARSEVRREILEARRLPPHRLDLVKQDRNVAWLQKLGLLGEAIQAIVNLVFYYVDVRHYEVSIDTPLVFGTRLRPERVTARFALAGSPWTYRENPGGFIGAVKRALGVAVHGE